MRGQIDECPNTFKQMRFSAVTREVQSFLRYSVRHCESLPSLVREKNNEVDRPHTLFREIAESRVTAVIARNEYYEEIMMYRTYIRRGIRDTKWEM